MSRIGKQPVVIPQGVKASIQGAHVAIEGPKGKLQYTAGPGVKIREETGKIILEANIDDQQIRADYGTARATINNMVLGVTKGWKKTLEMTGVGFGAKIAGPNLVLSCGFSHDVTLEIPATVKCAVNKTTIDLDSADKQLLGTFAAKIRKTQPPEPYLGKGIRYSTETVRRKAGKTGKK